MTADTFSSDYTLLQQKEMHIDRNCKTDLEALTSKLEEEWKHAEKRT